MNTPKSHMLLLSSLSAHYRARPEQGVALQKIIVGTSPVSLRVIDWFVTHYARINNIVYWLDDSTNATPPHMYETFPSSSHTQTHPNPNQHPNRLRKFNLYLEYRAQLQSYTKMYFDPFRRYERISFVLDNDPLIVIESTVGQLNFFRWALQNNVIDYITNHLADIEDAMSSFQSHIPPVQEEPTKQTTKQKTKEPTKKRGVAYKPNVITHMPCSVSFD